MAKIKMSQALDQLPNNTTEALHIILKDNLSDDFLVDLEGKKIHINFPEPQLMFDVHVTSASFENDVLSLTTNEPDAEPITINLGELKAKISEEDGNILVAKEDGLFVPTPKAPKQALIKDVFGETTVLKVLVAEEE